MLRELELVGQKDPSAAIKFSKNLEGFRRAFQKRKKEALTGFIHDSLNFGYGTSFFKVMLWKFMGKHIYLSYCPLQYNFVMYQEIDNAQTEILPTITRWEMEKNVWVNVRFPLNNGAPRDIPPDAILHESLIWRLKNDPTYSPKNNNGGHSPSCLKHKGNVAPFDTLDEPGTGAFGITSQVTPDPDHQTYTFANPPQTT